VTDEIHSLTEFISPDNLALLSDRGRQVLEKLVLFDSDSGSGSQRHVYSDWPSPGTDDAGKIALSEQLADLDSSYPGGISTYLSKAATLLRESAEGMNPFEEFVASVPMGESLDYEDDKKIDKEATRATTLSYGDAEKLGMSVVGDCVFVLVAGGLGERLGYSGIKLELETNLCTSQTYLEQYVRYIQALERRANRAPGTIPLVIMTSGDTDAGTRKLLESSNYYGMQPDQIIIVTQDKVPALKDGQAGLALSEKSRWAVDTKPHGHGDVHHLLYKTGLSDKWDKEGKKFVVFLQDTNLLVVNSVVPTLGVSVHQKFIMNSICIPRLAGEAAGAITRLE
jgi:UDP-sugar pyrophosphorylase